MSFVYQEMCLAFSKKCISFHFLTSHPAPFSSDLFWFGFFSVNKGGRRKDSFSRLKQFDALENDPFDTMSATQIFSQLCLNRIFVH